MKKHAAVVVLVSCGLVAATPASAEELGEAGGFIYAKKEKTLQGSPSEQVADVTAKCPQGSVHTGGGGTVTGKPAGTTLASSGTAADKQWFVEGWHTGINLKNETLTAWVVCSEKTGKITHETDSLSVGAGPAGANETADCIDSHAVGGGARLIGPTEDWSFNSTGPVDAGDVDEEPDDGWVTWVEHRSGPPANMIADVICMAGKLPTYRQKQTETDDSKVTETVFCPKDESATGGGAFASGATDESHITSTAPIDSKKDNDKVPDDGWKAKFFNDDGSEQTFTASVVCR